MLFEICRLFCDFLGADNTFDPKRKFGLTYLNTCWVHFKGCYERLFIRNKSFF